jgi:hypothetical protein
MNINKTNQCINDYILIVRKLLSSEQYTDYKTQVFYVLSISSSDDLNFILDCYYLFEDTQLAKLNFNQFGITGPTKIVDYGECYLRFYGLFNACYMQKIALLKCFEKLHLKVDENKIHSSPVFDFRNCFAAHSANVGRNNSHSYILGRHSLEKGVVEGYTANFPSKTKDPYKYKSKDISNLISDWDSLLVEHLRKIATHLFDNERITNNFKPEGFDGLLTKLDLINRVLDESAFCNDIWPDNPLVSTVCSKQQ